MKVKWKHARSSFPGAAVMIATTWIGIMKRILAVERLPNNLTIVIGNWSIGGFSYRFDVVRIEKRMGVLPYIYPSNQIPFKRSPAFAIGVIDYSSCSEIVNPCAFRMQESLLLDSASVGGVSDDSVEMRKCPLLVHRDSGY